MGEPRVARIPPFQGPHFMTAVPSLPETPAGRTGHDDNDRQQHCQGNQQSSEDAHYSHPHRGPPLLAVSRAEHTLRTGRTQGDGPESGHDIRGRAARRGCRRGCGLASLSPGTGGAATERKARTSQPGSPRRPWSSRSWRWSGAAAIHRRRRRSPRRRARRPPGPTAPLPTTTVTTARARLSRSRTWSGSLVRSPSSGCRASGCSPTSRHSRSRARPRATSLADPVAREPAPRRFDGRARREQRRLTSPATPGPTSEAAIPAAPGEKAP